MGEPCYADMPLVPAPVHRCGPSVLARDHDRVAADLMASLYTARCLADTLAHNVLALESKLTRLEANMANLVRASALITPNEGDDMEDDITKDDAADGPAPHGPTDDDGMDKDGKGGDPLTDLSPYIGLLPKRPFTFTRADALYAFALRDEGLGRERAEQRAAAVFAVLLASDVIMEHSCPSGAMRYQLYDEMADPSSMPPARAAAMLEALDAMRVVLLRSLSAPHPSRARQASKARSHDEGAR